MLKKVILSVGAGLITVLIVAGLWFFLFLNPRHYEVSDFDTLSGVVAAADGLRVTGVRGSLPEKDWPQAIANLSPKAVKVYPTGVIITLNGVFTLESGLYIPSIEVEKNLDKQGPETMYRKIDDRIFSYKIAG